MLVFAVVILLLAIAIGYSYSFMNLKQNKPTDEFHKDETKGWLILLLLVFVVPYVIAYFTTEKLIVCLIC